MKEKTLKIILIILIIVVIVISIIYIKSKGNNANNIPKLTSERIKELYDNSYKYYLLYEGNIETVGISTVNNEEYLIISEEFKSLDNITKIIDNTFLRPKRNIYQNAIFKNREYVMSGDNLLIKPFKSCESHKLNYSDLNVKYVTDTSAVISFNIVKVYAYYEEDNWYLNAPFHFCSTEGEINEKK